MFNSLKRSHLEWDAEWSGPQVIVEVSEKASNANGTNIEGNSQYFFFCYFSTLLPTSLRATFVFSSFPDDRFCCVQLMIIRAWFAFASLSLTYSHTAGPKIIVRTEEVLIVVAVLLIWAGAIALFFNRWGKIRMLEPYQPKFQQQHRSSCPLVELEAIPPHKHPSFSRISMGMSLQMPPGRMGSISGAPGNSLYTVRGKWVACFFNSF